MALNNPVIVTALFDIGRDQWDKFTMSYNTYLWWMRNTLALDSNIVIYTETKFVDEITKFRKEFDPSLEKTIIVVQELEELECYKLYIDSLQDLMFSDNFKNKISFPDVPEMSRPLYNIIMFNKVFFLKDTIDKKYFNNDAVIWADAGGLREDISNYKFVKFPNLSKLNVFEDKITFFSHNANVNIRDNEFHSLSQIRNIQGTCLIVPSKTINEFADLIIETINESISNGYIGSDEKIFDICYTKNKSLFRLIICSWREYFNILR